MEKLWRCYARPPRTAHREKTWRIVVVHPTGRVVVTASHIENEAEARELASVVERSYRETGLPPSSFGADPALTVGTIVDRNLEWRRAQGPDVEGCALATIEQLQQAREDLAGTLMQVPARLLKRPDVMLAQDKLRTGPRGRRGASRVNGLLALVASAWAWALDRGLVEQAWPKVKRLKVPATLKRPPTGREVVRIFDYFRNNKARRRWIPTFAAIYDSTARCSDVLACAEKQLDRATGRLRIWVKKGRHHLDVYLTAECLALLPPRGPDELLFPSMRDPRKKAVKNTLNNAMRRACKALGIQNVDVHSFRRKGVTDICRTPGVHEKQAMKVTGHKDPEIFHGYQERANDDMPAVWEKFHAARGPHPAACITEHHENGGGSGNANRYGAGSQPSTGPDSRSRPQGQLVLGAATASGSDLSCCTPGKSSTRRLTGRAASQAAERLVALARLGLEVRDALRELHGDRELFDRLVLAMDDAYPGERAPRARSGS